MSDGIAAVATPPAAAAPSAPAAAPAAPVPVAVVPAAPAALQPFNPQTSATPPSCRLEVSSMKHTVQFDIGGKVGYDPDGGTYELGTGANYEQLIIKRGEGLSFNFTQPVTVAPDGGTYGPRTDGRKAIVKRSWIERLRYLRLRLTKGGGRPLPHIFPKLVKIGRNWHLFFLWTEWALMIDCACNECNWWGYTRSNHGHP